MTDKLTANDWIDLALATLTREGYGALKADVLARSLKVSRGSFYWHFKDLAEFHCRVIERWREKATEAVIADVERHATANERFERLLRRAFGHDARIEIHLRAWARNNSDAARAIAEVDLRRRRYIEQLLSAAGATESEAQARALILYWAYLGAATSGSRLAGNELDRVVTELIRAALGAAGGQGKSGARSNQRARRSRAS
jgi:AcrR family transcriptional regulator